MSIVRVHANSHIADANVTCPLTSRAREMSDTTMSVLLLAKPEDVLEFVYNKGSAPGTTRLVTFLGLKLPRSNPQDSVISGLNEEGEFRRYSVSAVLKLVNISGAFREQEYGELFV
jgi:hypothetical protein